MCRGGDLGDKKYRWGEWCLDRKPDRGKKTKKNKLMERKRNHTRAVMEYWAFIRFYRGWEDSH